MPHIRAAGGSVETPSAPPVLSLPPFWRSPRGAITGTRSAASEHQEGFCRFWEGAEGLVNLVDGPSLWKP